MKKVMFFVVIFFISISAEGKILFSVSDNTQTNSIMYVLEPNTGKVEELFSFKNHPRVNTGTIFDISVSSDGKEIYFSSNNAYAYTPFSSNIFRIASDGSWIDQITPDKNSGYWEKGDRTVQGRVYRSNGMGWANCPVFLEGVGMVYSQADGSFVFKNVPDGIRYIVALRPGSNVYDAITVNVGAGGISGIQLKPDQDYRTGFSKPLKVGDRIYYKFSPKTIGYTDIYANSFNEVFDIAKTTSGCSGFLDIKGFDTGKKTGRVAIMDYIEGCQTNRGLYLIDGNGNNYTLIVDMKSDYNWNGGTDVSWSPDERFIAFIASYNWVTYLMIMNMSTGQIVGNMPFGNQYTLYNVKLYSWSPDGAWILFSYGQNNSWYLAKIEVNNGMLNTQNIVPLLNNVNIQSACWAELTPPTPPPAKSIILR